MAMEYPSVVTAGETASITSTRQSHYNACIHQMQKHGRCNKTVLGHRSMHEHFAEGYPMNKAKIYTTANGHKAV
ncbi:hypothetical protein XELAEV_18005293mg [Xenopus laevis]|uniref:Uncharacterized protein n=1 Tax=Xenopus laevis TaxID=8355 RepID=A0A974I383_XENLA|nr:hypothetical protein XELAEV_18005293mg [Xenopus laevis]